MEGRHHHHHHHHHHQQHHFAPQLAGSGGATTSMEAAASDSRFPQWSMQETKEFLIIRAELDRTFMETKRNKLLWEVISTKMREKGFNRSADQCKCKWKNLVTRYKGCETVEPDGMSRQQFPFYSDMQGIFTARMERMLWSEAQGGAAAAGGSGLARKRALSSSEDDEESDEGDQRTAMTPTSSSVRKQKKKGKMANVRSGGGSGELREILAEFMKQQMQMEAQWREACEAREEERRAREAEWIRNMEALESERLSMERRWRERQEQRMMREEARAEKRDALITCLLNKLRREESSSASHHQLPPPPS